jgi:hypothetical protein
MELAVRPSRFWADPSAHAACLPELIFIILPPLDYRVGLSPVPAYWSFVGDIVIVVIPLYFLGAEGQ